METRGRSLSRRHSSSTPANIAPSRPSTGSQAQAGPSSAPGNAATANDASTPGPLTRSRTAKGKRPALDSSVPSGSPEAPPTRHSKRARTVRQPPRSAPGCAPSRRTSARRAAAAGSGADAATRREVTGAAPSRSNLSMADSPNGQDAPGGSSAPPPPPPPLQAQADETGRSAPGTGPSNGDESEEADVSLQGLLRRLGAGLDDMFPQAGSSQTRLRNILSVLRGPAEEPARLDSLTQLCDYLSVGTEESMVAFSIDSFVPPLVTLLGEGNSPDTMLLAARALTHLMDALPASASSISQNNAAAPLCANLLTIEYIDLAEQSLAALEKLSIDYPQSIVRAGGFAAALSFIDFFSTGVQRVAAMTTCNMCRAPPVESLDMIVDMLPSMMMLLNNDDQRIRESIMLGFSRLADSFKTASDKLEKLCGGEDAALVERVISLIVPTSPPSLAPQSYSAALRLLATLGRGSANLSAKLLTAEALTFKLRELLAGNSSPHCVDCLNLADALLPETAADPNDTIAQSAVSATTTLPRSSRRRRSSSSLAAFASIDTNRREYLRDHPDALAFFGKTLLPSLFAFYQASADASARRTTLSIISKFLGLAPADVLSPLILSNESGPVSAGTSELSPGTRFAPFVAGLLGENCTVSESLAGLCLAHFSLSKLPEVKSLFTREGVMHEISRLAASAEPKESKTDETENAGSVGTLAVSAGDTEGVGGVGQASTASVPNRAGAAPSASASAPASVEATAGVPSLVAVVSNGSNVQGALAAGTTSTASTAPTADAARGGGVSVVDAPSAPPVGVAAGANAPMGANRATAGGSPSGIPQTGPARVGRGVSGTSPLPSSGLPLRLAPLRTLYPTAPEVSQATVSDIALGIVEKHVDDGSADLSGEGEVFRNLSTVAKALKNIAGASEPSNGQEELFALSSTLGQASGVTTFELTRSGVVGALESFLSAEGLSSSVRTQRTVRFVESLNAHAASGAFALLVARVLGSFASEEKLPICISEGYSGGHGLASASVGNGLRQLVQPFKLCLRRAPASEGGKDLRDYSHHVVLIEPLATMASVEEFLWSRVQSHGAHSEGEEPFPAGHRGPGSVSNGQDEVNDLVLDEEDDEPHIDEDDDDDVHEGDDGEDMENEDEDDGDMPEEMFAMEEDVERDGVEGDEGEDVQQSDEDFSSGSEDVIGEENDDDPDADDMDDDSAFGGPLARSLPAVELDHDALAQSPRPTGGRKSNTESAPTQGRGAGSSSAARSGAGGDEGGGGGASGSGRSRRTTLADATAGPPRSYAAALASGMQQAREERATSEGASQRRSGRQASQAPRRLNFMLNSRVVAQDSSILHAVLQSRSDGLTVGPRLWSEVYTLTYSRASTGTTQGSVNIASVAGSAPATRTLSSAGEEGVDGGPSAARSRNVVRGTRRSRRLSGRSASADLSTVASDAMKPEPSPAPSMPSAAHAVLENPPGTSTVAASSDEEVGRGASKAPPVPANSERKAVHQTAVPGNIPELTSSEILDRSTAFVPSLTISGGLPESVHEVVQLLKRLNWIYRVMTVGPHADSTAMTSFGPGETATLRVDAVDFVSQKITAKLHRQLLDPLALCGGVIPGWCHTLAREASFLVPFATRQMLFQSTALGVARALNLLQQRSDASSVAGDTARQGVLYRTQAMRETEARINRIQRQKVRIHRSRVLESAMRVMSMYSSHRTVLEVEYFDEVGTGLGPTLEFYTLVSRELQRVSLGLWRGKESVKSQEQKDRRAVSVQSAPIAVPVSKPAGGSSQVPPAPTRPRLRPSIDNGANPCTPVRRNESADDDDEYIVPTGRGLIPSCIPHSDSGNPEFAQRLSYFPFVGRLVAKALSDGRLLDLRLSRVFAKLLLAFCSIMVKKEVDTSKRDRSGAPDDRVREGSAGPRIDAINVAAVLSKDLEAISDTELWREFAEGTPGLSLLREVDPQLTTSLQNVLDMAQGNDRSSVQDLCLSFVLPENEQIELCRNGSSIEVTGENAVEYVAAVVRFVLCSGVRRQAEAFLRGFCDVLDLKCMLLFQADELELLICGPSFEEWSTDFLVQTTRCDHGYRHESDAVVFLLRVLSELDAEDQRRFVMFATGSPALPVGGLKGLHPRLTIVKRTPEGGRSPDECLPTVMTCTNYFKLPDYSSYEITKSRLLYAMREGQGSFHLS